jgi:hypothetical protein
MPVGLYDNRLARFDAEPRLGAIQAGDAELGPISPELALVDPALAETARQLLPDPRERSTSRPRPVAASTPLRVVEQPEQTAPPARPRRRGWRRAVLLAGLVLVFGAVAGGFFAERPAVSPETTLEIRSGAPTETRSGREKQPAQKSASSSAGAPLQLPKVSDEPLSRVTTTGPQAPPARHVTWAANVLGVAAQVDRPGVTLVWQRPAGSVQVVVLRSLAAHARNSVVYRGRASSYRDASPRPCTAYRYTIVNYDGNGRRSTGVPTSVVTGGCT